MFCRVCFFLSSKKCVICKQVGTKHPQHQKYKDMKQMWDGLRAAQAVTTGDWRTDCSLRWHFGEWMRGLTQVQHTVNMLLAKRWTPPYSGFAVETANPLMDAIRFHPLRIELIQELKLRGYSCC